MANRVVSISVKLIVTSTLMLVIVISLFGFINRVQSRKTIDQASARLRAELTRSMETAGKALLQLLRETTRTLVQDHKATLQTIVHDTGRWDDRLAAVVVLDPDGIVLAHSDPRRIRTASQGPLRQAASVSDVEVQSDILVDDQKAMTFAAPVSAKGVRVATIFLAYRMAPLEVEFERTQTLRTDADSASLRSNLYVGALALLVGLLLTIVQGVRLTRPIQALVRQVDRMAAGDLEGRVQVTSHDEIGLLGERFNHMAERVLVLLQETKGKASMEEELSAAGAVQATLVPERQVVRLKGIELAGHFRPATRCGGDWWSHFKLTEDRTLVLIGDVTGHGVGSAMITAAAQGSASTMMAVTNNAVDLRALLHAMNAAIHTTARGKFAMTCFGSIYDPQTQTLYYANAGHNFAYHHDLKTKKLSALVARGNRLGDLAASSYDVKELKLKPGDALFWYTDGIVECVSPRGEEYGEKRFREAAQRVATKPAQAALEMLLEEANSFYEDVPLRDDITLVVAKIGK